MVRHLRNKVEAILQRGILKDGDLIIDIGSNDATTLKSYPQNRFELLGVDPTGVKFAEYYPTGIALIPDFFSSAIVQDRIGDRKATVITSFSMFYDLENPVAFAKEIAQTLEGEGIWVFEQSYLPSMLETHSFDTICHEHLEFYALRQVQWIAASAGLKIIDVEFNRINGGSFSITAARQESRHAPNQAVIDEILRQEDDLQLRSSKPYERFRADVDQAKEALIAFLETARKEGKTVYGLGASTKGNVLLQYFGITPADLPKIAEVNTDKVGALTPGTLIPIIAQEQALAEQPDYWLVLPWHFRDFFVTSEKFRGQTLVFPLPFLEIVTP